MRWGGHEISFVSWRFGGVEVWVHGVSAILYYVYANIFTILYMWRIEVAEMKLLRNLAGYKIYIHKTNDYIGRELRIKGIIDKIDKYRRNWFSHMQRMPQNRIPLKSYLYRPQGRRTIGRPKKRWREQLQLWRRDGSKGPVLNVWWWWWYYVCKIICTHCLSTSHPQYSYIQQIINLV